MAMFSSRNWREYPQRYRLEAVRFKKSGKTYFPPRSIDPENRDTERETVRLPDTGKIVTYTVVRVAPSQWGDMAPYALAIVRPDKFAEIQAKGLPMREIARDTRRVVVTTP